MSKVSLQSCVQLFSPFFVSPLNPSLFTFPLNFSSYVRSYALNCFMKISFICFYPRCCWLCCDKLIRKRFHSASPWRSIPPHTPPAVTWTFAISNWRFSFDLTNVPLLARYQINFNALWPSTITFIFPLFFFVEHAQEFSLQLFVNFCPSSRALERFNVSQRSMWRK